MIYKWKNHGFPVKAQEAGEELERIEQSKGGIKPKYVIDEARPEGAILHNCFNWNDVEAAELYREVQARELIRNIVVVKVAEAEQEITPTRAFVSVQNEDESPQYISIRKAMTEVDYQEQILQKAFKELEAFKQKYSGLVQLKKVFDSISEVLKVS